MHGLSNHEESKASAMTTSWVPYRRPLPRATLRLFCFPYAGGSASLFRHWSDLLAPTIEVCPVELPGRGTRLAEPAFTRIAPLVSAAADGLLPILDRPFALFGHSMGALVAFELTRTLRRDYGLHPVRLVASAHRAPHLARVGPPTHTLPDREFTQKLRQLAGTPREILDHPELMALLQPILRADFAVCDTYTFVPDKPLSCPISAFGGLQDPLVTCPSIAAWRDQTAGAFAMRMVPGGHLFLQASPALLPMLLAGELAPTARRAS